MWMHQLSNAQPSLWSNSYTHIWLLEKFQLWLHSLWLAKSLLLNMLSLYGFCFVIKMCVGCVCVCVCVHISSHKFLEGKDISHNTFITSLPHSEHPSKSLSCRRGWKVLFEWKLPGLSDFLIWRCCRGSDCQLDSLVDDAEKQQTTAASSYPISLLWTFHFSQHYSWRRSSLVVTY